MQKKPVTAYFFKHGLKMSEQSGIKKLANKSVSVTRFFKTGVSVVTDLKGNIFVCG